MAGSAPNGQAERTAPVKRIRWATQRVTGQQAANKRKSIFNRRLSRRGVDEKKRESSGSFPGEAGADADTKQGEEDDGEQPESRTLYFNIPLPASERDEEGAPLHHYPRNKIRTAKYTPISFIPKNLYYQFHNIANVFFFIVIILGVCITMSHVAPVPMLTVQNNRFSPSLAFQIQVSQPYRL